RDVDVPGPVLVVAVREVLAPVRAAGLLACGGGRDERGGHREQVGGLPGGDVGVVGRAGGQVGQGAGTGGETVAGAQHAAALGHRVLQRGPDIPVDQPG